MLLLFFFFNDTATTEIYTLSLHDALPIFHCRHKEELHIAIGFVLVDNHLHSGHGRLARATPRCPKIDDNDFAFEDRKSTRLNSSHANISYAVFCLKKKKKIQNTTSKHKRV